MKPFLDDSGVRAIGTWQTDREHAKQVEMFKRRKRRWNCFVEFVAVVMSTIALLACFSWFDIGWPARIIGIVALTSVVLLAFGEDDEDEE